MIYLQYALLVYAGFVLGWAYYGKEIGSLNLTAKMLLLRDAALSPKRDEHGRYTKTV